MVSLWVIYDHPEDYPDNFVVREQKVSGNQISYSTPVIVASVDEARSAIPPGLFRLPRDPSYVLAIVETWI